MNWTKDSFEWRSDIAKRDLIDHLQKFSYDPEARLALAMVREMKPPFRVTEVGGPAPAPVLIEIIDSVGTVYNATNLGVNGLLYPKHRPLFKKCAPMRTPSEMRQEDVELISLLNCMEDFAQIRINGYAPATNKQELLKALRTNHQNAVKTGKNNLKHHQQRLAKEKDSCSEYYDKLVRLGVENPNE